MFFAISFKGQDSPFQSSMSEDNPAVPNTAPSQFIMLHQFFFFLIGTPQNTEGSNFTNRTLSTCVNCITVPAAGLH